MYKNINIQYLALNKGMKTQCHFASNPAEHLKGLCHSFVNKSNTQDIVRLLPDLHIRIMADGARVHR